MGNMRKSPGMPRRKYKSDFPHVVEMVVPEGGLRNRRVAMFDFHKGWHPEEVRKRIQTSQLINPLQNNAKARKPIMEVPWYRVGPSTVSQFRAIAAVTQ